MFKKKLCVIVFIVAVGGTSYAQSSLRSTNPAVNFDTTTTFVISDFDDHSVAVDVNNYNGGKYDIDWTSNILPSRYITQYPKLGANGDPELNSEGQVVYEPFVQTAVVEGYPLILSRDYVESRGDALRIFALRAKFNKKGNNSISLYPIDNKNTLITQEVEDENGNIVTVPQQGVFFYEPVYEIGLYALGLLRYYKVEATFQNAQGEIFTVQLGNLNYKGWRILSARLPIERYINEEMYINQPYLLRLERLSIRTIPGERVDEFVAYFDQIFVIQPGINGSRYYDGYDISRTDFQNKIDWTQMGSNTTSSGASSNNNNGSNQ